MDCLISSLRAQRVANAYLLEEMQFGWMESRGKQAYPAEGAAWHCHVGCRGMTGQAGSMGPDAAAYCAAGCACPDSFEPSAAVAAKGTAPVESKSCEQAVQSRLYFPWYCCHDGYLRDIASSIDTEGIRMTPVGHHEG